MVETTPLLLLLDGILSQDADRTSTAVQQIQDLVGGLPLQDSPLRSARALENIIETLMTCHPQLAQAKSRNDDSLPLHFAASIGNIRVARLLLEQFRKAALMPNSKGKIPLHYAAREGRTDMVLFMLQSVPETASVLSKKGKLPLHFAAGDGHADVVKALLQINPQGANLPSKKGKVALHFAARWGHMKIAKDLVHAFPNGVKTLDYDGSLPLHDAAREGQLEMAQFLVECYPQGLRKENIRGETPLFPAIRSGNKDLCTYFLKLWPGGGKQVLRMVSEDDNLREWEDGLLDLCLRSAVDDLDEDPDDNLFISSDSPLNDKEDYFEEKTKHDTVALIPSSAAASSRPSEATLDIYLPRSKSPILVEVKNRKKRCHSFENGLSNKRSYHKHLKTDKSFRPLEASSKRCFFQLHAALECNASSPVLEYVLDKHADQLMEEDDLGKLPLHLAAQHCSARTIPIILDRIWKPCKEACSKRDFLGRLPLHLALKSRADSTLIRALLDANPPSAVEDCEIVDPAFMNRLPIFMATEYQCDLSTVYMLLREDPSVLKKR